MRGADGLSAVRREPLDLVNNQVFELSGGLSLQSLQRTEGTDAEIVPANL